jgi:enoyl-CoA hydratase
MVYQTIDLKIEELVEVITINRPTQLNALNIETLNELDNAISEADKNPDILAVIITGSGKAFIAGADISLMVNMVGTEAKEFSKIGQGVINHIENLTKPVIAAINGYALGGGCELAMACDIRYASDKAKFGQPEINLGVIPGFGGTQRLPRLVGSGVAMELLMTGNIIDAIEALRIGLVDKVFPPEELMAKTLELAKIITFKCPKAVVLNKKAVRAGIPKMAQDEEATLFGQCFETGIAKEGMTAFLNKTQPKWK